MQQIVEYTPALSLIVSRQGQFLLDRIALSSDDETVCVSTSLPVDDSIDLAVASVITFFTSAAMPFRTCGLEIKFYGATFTRAHLGFVEWCHAIEYIIYDEHELMGAMTCRSTNRTKSDRVHYEMNVKQGLF